MSSIASMTGTSPGDAHPDGGLHDEATRRRLSARRAATVQRLGDAAVAELAVTGYDELTVRRVARRAGVAPATAYTYFTSKAHLVAEAFWRRLRARPDTPLDAAAPAADRVGAVLRDIASLVAGEPALAAACTPALLGSDPDVRHLRDRIGAELHRRIDAALSASAAPGAADDTAAPGAADDTAAPGPADDTDTSDKKDDLVTALDLMLAGALVRAGTGHMPYADLGDTLSGLTRLVIGDRA